MQKKFDDFQSDLKANEVRLAEMNEIAMQLMSLGQTEAALKINTQIQVFKIITTITIYYVYYFEPIGILYFYVILTNYYSNYNKLYITVCIIYGNTEYFSKITLNFIYGNLSAQRIKIIQSSINHKKSHGT